VKWTTHIFKDYIYKEVNWSTAQILPRTILCQRSDIRCPSPSPFPAIHVHVGYGHHFRVQVLVIVIVVVIVVIIIVVVVVCVDDHDDDLGDEEDGGEHRKDARRCLGRGRRAGKVVATSSSEKKHKTFTNFELYEECLFLLSPKSSLYNHCTV
jgi:hypothetical protein